MSIIPDRPDSTSLIERKLFSVSPNDRRSKKGFASVVAKTEGCREDASLLAASLPLQGFVSGTPGPQRAGFLAGERTDPGATNVEPAVFVTEELSGALALPGSQGLVGNLGLACIKSHIITKSPYAPFYDNTTDIEFYPGMVTFKRQDKETDWHKRVKAGRNKAMSKRGEITSFSKKSRSNFLKLFGKIEGNIELWIDLTFHDQVLKEHETTNEKAKFSSDRMRVFMQWFQRNYPEAWLLWKREWQPRKSGILEGDNCPHLHCFLGGIPEEEIHRILRKWVDITKVTGDHRLEAMKVAFHHRSWRRITSANEAQRYATKYGSKVTEACGRSWGKVGPVPIAEPKHLNLTAYQQVLLRRVLRGYTKGSKKRKNRGTPDKYLLANRLRRNDFQGFILMPGMEVIRIIEYIREVTGSGDEEEHRMYGRRTEGMEETIERCLARGATRQIMRKKLKFLSQNGHAKTMISIY